MKSVGLVSIPERFTKNAALGILAHVALYAAGCYSLSWDLKTHAAGSVQRPDAARIKQLYHVVADACKQIIPQGQNNFLPSFEPVFRSMITGTYDNNDSLNTNLYK